MEYLYRRNFTMKKNDEAFSNKYDCMTIEKDEKLIYINFCGRWTGNDDLVLNLPAEMEFVGCEFFNNRIKCSFLYRDKPAVVIVKLTNKKERTCSI